jgi:adenylate cyclase
VRLRDGDALGLGPCRLRFRQAEASPPPALHTDTTQVTLMDVRQQACWLLVADIAGSTVLAQTMPPDELAVIVGRWFLDCRGLIEQHGGILNKYLGDGFLSYWNDREGTAAALAATLAGLRARQDAGQPVFRLAVHWGPVVMGGAATLGEENLAGSEVNFVFRMDKLAKALQRRALLSDVACRRLGSLVASSPVGEHPLPGFSAPSLFHEF